MKTLKYIGVILCALAFVEAIPSVWLISAGLLDGNVAAAQEDYFAWKLVLYLVLMGVYVLAGWWLLRSARRQPVASAE